MVVDRTPAAERAYGHTKEQILTGVLPGGHLFAEGDIAAELGVSRTPVREALLRLQNDGLVRLIPKRGAVVVATSAAEARDVRELRLAIEVAAVERLDRDAADVGPLVARLTRSIADQEACNAAGDLRGFLAADAAFHHLIVSGSGNALADRLYTTLNDRQRRINLTWLEAGTTPLGQLVSDHRKLTRLVGKRDVPAFATALQAHLNRSQTGRTNRS